MNVFQAGQALPSVPGVYVAIAPPQTNFLSPAKTDILGVVGSASWGPVNQPVPVAGAAAYPASFGPIVRRTFDLGTAVYLATLQGAQNMRCVRVTDGTDTAATSFLGLQGAGTVVAGGTLYTTSSVVTLSNGAVINVTAVSGGAITAFTVSTQPTSKITGTGAVTAVSATGGGSGATFTFTYTQGAAVAGLYTGSAANGDTITLAAGSAVGTWKVTVFRPGLSPEIYNNIGLGLTGLALWTAIVYAVNNGTGVTRPKSALVALTVGTSTAAPTALTVTQSGGTDGATSITTSNMIGVDTTGARTGMYALRKTGASVGVIADLADSASWSAQAAFALSEGVYMIASGPNNDTISNAVTTKASLGIDTYGLKVMFGDWAIYVDPASGGTWGSTTAPFVAGWIAANGPQFSSLNKPLYGIVATAKSATNTPYQADELALLQGAGIDVVINPSPGGAYFSSAFGQNSSSNNAVNGDNYTRMTNFLAATFVNGLGEFIGQLQLPATQLEAKATLDAFLQDLFDKSAIGSSDPTQPAFLVVLDSTNNPQSQVAQGIMLAQVFVTYASVIQVFEVQLQGGQGVTVNTISTTSQV